MIIDPEKTPMMDVVRVAFHTAELAGREDLMIRCQQIANAAHALDNLYKASPSDPEADRAAILAAQKANRKGAEIQDIDDYMELSIKAGIQYYGFTDDDFDNFFHRYVNWTK